MTDVKKTDIVRAFEELKITGKRVVIHSSLRSFGNVAGGADTVLAAILESFETVMMPAFCWDSNTTPPENDRPPQNGCDYKFYENWNRPLKPFIVESAGIEKSLGIIPRKFVALPQVCRSDHSWHSWSAVGYKAKYLTADHLWNTTNLPIERLAAEDGFVVLMGTGLRTCTAIHISEEKAGRRPFVRWAVDRDGKTKRVSASGCGKGFDNLMPYCKHLFAETYVGSCRILSARLQPLIDHLTSVILEAPQLTRCSPGCVRCADSIAGGPPVDYRAKGQFSF